VRSKLDQRPTHHFTSTGFVVWPSNLRILLIPDNYDCNPQDPYACSKLCGERVARSFAKRYKSDIYAFRIGNVFEPHEYADTFPSFFTKPQTRMRNAWSYIDARDLGQMCDLAIQKNGLGFQVSTRASHAAGLAD
jgi:nucleoside-diphosphate-sugar epimerase